MAESFVFNIADSLFMKMLHDPMVDADEKKKGPKAWFAWMAWAYDAEDDVLYGFELQHNFLFALTLKFGI